jgi:O-antigen/teichoic acid export membrane protein
VEPPEPAGGGPAAQGSAGAAVIGGGLWGSASVVLPQLYTVVLSVVAARALGPGGMGRQSFIAFAEVSATVLLTAGLPFSLMRHVGATIGEGRPEAVRRLVAWAWRLEVGAAVAGAAILVAVGLTRSSLRSAWLLAALAAALTILQTVPSSVLIGMQRWRDASVVGLTTGAVGLVATIVVLSLGGGIVGMFAVEVVVAAVNLAWTQRLAAAARSPLWTKAESGDAGGDLVRRARRYAAIETLQVLVFFVVQRRSELFFLERYSAAQQIAMYSIAFSAVTAVVRVPQAFVGALAPAVATLFGAGAHERIQAGFGRALRLVLVMTLPLAAAVATLGPAGLRLVYGGEYDDAGRVLLLMAVVVPVIPLASVSFTVLSAVGRQWVPLVIGALASVVNVSCDALLVPAHAAAGAAVANGIAQVAMGVPMVVYGCRVVGAVRWDVGALARVAVAATAAGVAAAAAVDLLGGWVGLVLGGVAFVAVLAVLAVVLKVLPAEDASWLDEAAGARFGGLVGRACRLLAAAGQADATTMRP